MTTLNYTVNIKKTVLASLIGLCISQSSLALEALSDESLGEATGEGIGLLPQNAYMIFRGANSGNQTEATILSDRTLDTGSMYYVPVGGLTSLVQDTNKDGSVTNADHSVGKADLYLYGLAISKNAANNSNNRLDPGVTGSIANAAIKSWGTATNPWLLNAKTVDGIPDFGTGTGSITALNFEAPLYEDIYKFSNNVLTVNTLSKDVDGADAYNLKLGLWADAFVRDQSKVNNDPNQFNLGEGFGTNVAGRANRIRLQGVFNGFSLNGSKIQLFQTLGGATNTGGLSVFYNNTLGLAGAIRLNSGDGSKLLATVSGNTWTVPVGLNNKILRLSTQECGAGSLSNVASCTGLTPQRILATPALGGGLAPVFDATEGAFIYNLNTNLILGSSYQPLIVGSDGTNFNLEVARLPNKASIYQQVYTAYAGSGSNPDGSLSAADTANYKGSTCNVYTCGTASNGYQGGNATHSSISIGTVKSLDSGKTLIADNSVGAVGISFRQLGNNNSSSSPVNNLGSAVIDGMLIQHMKITTKGL